MVTRSKEGGLGARRVVFGVGSHKGWPVKLLGFSTPRDELLVGVHFRLESQVLDSWEPS